MGVIAWIIVGAVAGLLGAAMIGARDGPIPMVVLGIAGALVGGFVTTNVLSVGPATGLNPQGVFLAAVGAVLSVSLVSKAQGSFQLRRH